MLIKNLKKYPKQSQFGSNISNAISNAQGIVAAAADAAANTGVQTNLYTAGGEYELPDGTEFIGDYHIHPVQGPMVGATHSRGTHASLTSITPVNANTNRPTTTVGGALVGRTTGLVAPIGNPISPPTLIELAEYEKYIVSGSVYKSNIKSINDRDKKGNIQLNESASLIPGNINENLVFEPVSNNFTNRSVLSAIDTQFSFFKFPAQISTTVQDLEFDESLLDIDVQAGILNDPYQGKLIRNQTAFGKGLYLVQGTGKRKFEITNRSIWALKNNLPPFANINGDIDGLDPGERNDTGDDGVKDNTFKNVAPGIFDGYENLDPYYPEDAFAEGNIYGRLAVKLSEAYDNLPLPADPTPNFFIDIKGASFGKVLYSDINSSTFDTGEFTYLRRLRDAEFDVQEFSNSTIRIDSNLPSDDSYVGQFNDPEANFIFNIFNIDPSNGNSYLTFVQNAFRDYVRGNVTGWNIQQIAKRDKKPKQFLDGLKSPGDPSGNSGWGGNVTYYKIKADKLQEEDDSTRLYRLTVPTPGGAITNTGYSYKIYKNNQEITDLLMASSGVRAKTHTNSSANSGVPFQDTTTGFTNRGFTLDMNEVFPNNEFIPNTSNELEIEIDTFQPAGSTFDLSFVFVGLNRWAGADNNSSTSDIPPSDIKVVPNTIMIETAGSAGSMWDGSADYSRNWDRVDNLKNWRAPNTTGDYLRNDWNANSNVKKVPNSYGGAAGDLN